MKIATMRFNRHEVRASGRISSTSGQSVKCFPHELGSTPGRKSEEVCDLSPALSKGTPVVGS
jgi:hypothetical protein